MLSPHKTAHYCPSNSYCDQLVALRQADKSWTYAQLGEQVERTYHALAKALPPYPVTVGLCMWNQAEWVFTLLALWQLGHVVVPLNPTLTPSELAQLSTDAQLSLLITDDRPLCGVVGHWHQGLLQLPNSVEANPLPPVPPNLALLIYTSGTTGKPKGVMLTHDNIWADVSANIQVIQATAADRFISQSPFFHVFGLINVLLTSLTVGGQLTLVRRFHPGQILGHINQGGVTVLTGVPTMYQQLLRHTPINFSLSRIRVCHSGAAPMPEPLLHQIEQHFNAPVQEGYGLSEASSIVTSNPLTGLRKPGSIGVAIPGVTTSLRDKDGTPVELPDEPGQLWVSGPTVMPGYWGQLSTDKLIIKNDMLWLKTGDVMTRDTDGYYRFLGRSDDQLNLGGLKCYPVEIETVLLTYPGVLEAAVFINAKTGTLCGQLVTQTPDINTPQMRRYLLDKLSPYKVPKTFISVDNLPKGPTGKLLRSKLNLMT